MNSFIMKLSEINKKSNDVPRRLLIILVTSACLWLCCIVFKFIAPLVCALVFSWLIRPLAKPIEKLFSKMGIPSKLGVLIAVLIVFGIIAALVILAVSILTSEARDMLEALPYYIEDVAEYITLQVENGTELIQARAGDEAINTVYEMAMSVLNKLAETASVIAAGVVSFTFTAVSSIPDIIMVVLFTIMESYYLVADRDDLARFFKKWAPGNMGNNFDRVKKAMFLGVRAQIVAAILEMFAAGFVLAVGFWAMDLDYALMLATLIAVLDALPVIGAGLIMFPMILYYLIVGEYMLSLGVLVLYLVVQVVKRIMEPKLVGSQMKINQLATMISMYAGYVMVGFLGILVGPILLMLFSVVLDMTSKKDRPMLEDF